MSYYSFSSRSSFFLFLYTKTESGLACIPLVSKLCAFCLSVTSAMSCWDMCLCFQIATLPSFPRWGTDLFNLLATGLRAGLFKWIKPMEGLSCSLHGTVLCSHLMWVCGLMEMAKYLFQGPQHGIGELLIMWITLLYLLMSFVWPV